ncbi:MAG: hypothetical protein OQJ97_02710, partial [Rhodospirillales bacterium]|nr:hypothetical protein [Rhodospirillales bacterium]
GAYVAWCAKLPDTRTSGWSGSPSITTGVTEKYNATLGMSIVKYTGNGTAGATIPHSLGKKPFMMIIKRLDVANDWRVYHEAVGATKQGQLNSTNAFATGTAYYNDTEPTSQLITLGSNDGQNASSGEYIAYIFCETDFCKPIEYTGNGNADGPFVNLGVKPEFILQKKTSGTADWNIVDSSRDPFNPVGQRLLANSSSAEDLSYDPFDFVSTGLKLRDAAGSWNTNGDTYIGLAIGRPTQAAKGN